MTHSICLECVALYAVTHGGTQERPPSSVIPQTGASIPSIVIYQGCISQDRACPELSAPEGCYM